MAEKGLFRSVARGGLREDGGLLTTLTFPGVVVHEAAHQLFCKLFGVRVLKVCYFQFGECAGYVEHEEVRRPMPTVLIGIAPLFVNTAVALALGLLAALPLWRFPGGFAVEMFLLWLAVAAGMHAFPSKADAESIWRLVRAKETPAAARALLAVVVGGVHLGVFASQVGSGFLYALGLAFLFRAW